MQLDLLDISPVRRFMFFGVPGCGKSYIVTAFAAELMDKGLDFIELRPSDIYAPGGAELIEEVFSRAAEKPTVVFFDEFEIFSYDRRKANIGVEAKRITAALLGACRRLSESDTRSVIIGATNNPMAIDPAVCDSFIQIYVPLPEREDRRAYFGDAFSFCTSEAGAVFGYLSDGTENYSFRDLEKIIENINEQLFEALKDELRGLPDADRLVVEKLKSGNVTVTREMCEKALAEVQPTDTAELRKSIEEFEAGIWS